MKKPLLGFVLFAFLSGCGLTFVQDPPYGWQETQDIDALTRMSLLHPCTSSRALVGLDVLAIALGVAGNLDPNAMGGTRSDEALKYVFTGPLILGGGIGAIMGLNKANDCRAFNARLMELGGGDAVGQASYEWSDELFPIPDFRANALFPVRSLNLNR